MTTIEEHPDPRSADIKHTACCSCGALSITVSGEPVRVSICHCLACQRRTGSVFGAQARFMQSQIVAQAGMPQRYRRTADSGNTLTFNFCGDCGSTVFYKLDDMPEIIAIPIGGFADPGFMSPKISVYESRKHSWVVVPHGPGVEHRD